MALFSECMPQCARKVLDSADIVREALVSTTIYAVWGLPINELYTSGPCRPLIRFRPRQILA